MFKAFIADDDVLAVENIYISFDWERLGVSDVVKIYNPHALSDKIMSERPHIVF